MGKLLGYSRVILTHIVLDISSLCKISALRKALSELLRFFVDARAAPAIWISGLPLDDEIPPTPALPGDFRLPVSEAGATSHSVWVGSTWLEMELKVKREKSHS